MIVLEFAQYLSMCYKALDKQPGWDKQSDILPATTLNLQIVLYSLLAGQKSKFSTENKRELRESQFSILFCDFQLLVSADKSSSSNVEWKCLQCDAGDRGTEAFMTCSLIMSLSGVCQLNA